MYSPEHQSKMHLGLWDEGPGLEVVRVSRLGALNS